MKLLLLLIFASGLYVSIAAPTNNQNVFEMYVKTKCPIVKDNVDFFQHPIFNKCSNANVTISSSIEYLKSELNEQNKNDLLCNLFLNKFLTLCDKFQQASIAGGINLKPELSNDIYGTCDNLTKASSIFGEKTIVCLKFCSDDQGNVLPHCALANYYATYETKSTVSGNAVDAGNVDQYIRPSGTPTSKVLDQIGSDTAGTEIKPGQSIDDPQNIGDVNNQELKGPATNNVGSTITQTSNAHNLLPSINDKEKNSANPDNREVNSNPESKPNDQEEDSKKTQTGIHADANLDAVPVVTKDQTDTVSTGTKSRTPGTAPTGSKGQTSDNVPTGTKGQTSDTGPTGTKGRTSETAPTGTKDRTQETAPTGTKDRTLETAPTGAKDRTSEKVEQSTSIKKVTLATDTNAEPEIPPQEENQPTNQEEVDLDDDKRDFAEQDENNQPVDFDDNTNTDGDQDKTQPDTVKEEPKQEKPEKIEEDGPVSNSNMEDIDGESYFFSYFMVVCVLFVLGYIFYHNRTKVMALVLEGKRGKRQYRGRRPNSANYHKLDSNLEEAISSSCSKNSSNIIY